MEWDFETFLPLEPKNIETGREVVVDLSVEQCTELQRALIEIDFWSLPVKIEYDLGNDGAHFIIQAIKGEQYHITDRWDPSEEYREIFKYVLNTAGLFNDRFEQY